MDWVTRDRPPPCSASSNILPTSFNPCRPFTKKDRGEAAHLLYNPCREGAFHTNSSAGLSRLKDRMLDEAAHLFGDLCREGVFHASFLAGRSHLKGHLLDEAAHLLQVDLRHIAIPLFAQNLQLCSRCHKALLLIAEEGHL